MIIDRQVLESELRSVRDQQQQAAKVLEQTIGAEKAILAILQVLDRPDGDGEVIPISKNKKSGDAK